MAVLALPQPQATRRDAMLPAVPDKVHAVIGMRRAGKTTFLRQLQAEWRAAASPERAVYLSFASTAIQTVANSSNNPPPPWFSENP